MQAYQLALRQETITPDSIPHAYGSAHNQQPNPVTTLWFTATVGLEP